MIPPGMTTHAVFTQHGDAAEAADFLAEHFASLEDGYHGLQIDGQEVALEVNRAADGIRSLALFRVTVHSPTRITYGRRAFFTVTGSPCGQDHLRRVAARLVKDVESVSTAAA